MCKDSFVLNELLAGEQEQNSGLQGARGFGSIRRCEVVLETAGIRPSASAARRSWSAQSRPDREARLAGLEGAGKHSGSEGESSRGTGSVWQRDSLVRPGQKRDATLEFGFIARGSSHNRVYNAEHRRKRQKQYSGRSKNFRLTPL